jgi:hypothetical protein
MRLQNVRNYAAFLGIKYSATRRDDSGWSRIR